MGLEKRVEALETHVEALDAAVLDLLETTKNTHQILIECQQENRIRFAQMDREIAALKDITLNHEKRFDQIDERFDQIDKRFDQMGEDIADLKVLIVRSLPVR